MSVPMRAKVVVQSVERYMTGPDTFSTEKLTMYPVAKNGSYPADGSDENNTFAKFSPSGKFELSIANPALHGKFKQGDTFYVDFTPVEK